MKTLQISDRTHQRLLDHVHDFGETAEDVIQRLLARAEGASAEDSKKEVRSYSGSPLVSKGGRLPHGTTLKASYKGREYEARVRDGKLYWEGSAFDSPSSAAVSVIQSTGSSRTTENGWRFWDRARLPDEDEWRPTSVVRKEGVVSPSL